ncbi:cytosine permease [Geodermatophilus sp. TF02-6]|uniref:purine-cytosine permease family protein n=1 Tax=Geodermatophilus sp. TF02-6 TaxID=2250575 RepID=UPI000DE8FC62|nr:cytosine permease [Geodermatophilus sp. TF02-6]RBY78877.1 cytosine permease [Geodermatophilus sp. TF02-6]
MDSSAAAAAPEDRGYRDKIAAVEPYGVDHIPDAERHGKGSSQFFIWFAAGLNFPIMVLGFSAVSFGLSFAGAVSAIVIGSLVGALVQGLLAQMGARLGVPQQIQARGPLGFFGNFLPVAYINVFAGVGWAAVTVILGSKAFHELVPAIPEWLCAFVVVALQLVVAVYGYNMIHYLQRILTYVLFAGFVMISVVSVVRGGGTAIEANPDAPFYVGSVGGWITFAGYFLSFLIAWWPFASDYSRYLPDDDRTSRSAGIWTVAGNFISLSWLGIAGALLGGAAVSGEDPISALNRLTGPLATPALLIVLLSSFSQNFLNVYGGAISIQTLRIPISRRAAVVLICVAAYAISLWAGSGFQAKFETFLFLSAYLIAPFGAVLLFDYFIGDRRDKSRIPELYDESRILNWGFVAWLGGTVASVPFWQLAFYVGPFATAHPEWGDLSYFVGFAVSAVLYLLTYRLPPLWRSSRRAPRRIEAGAATSATDGERVA